MEHFRSPFEAADLSSARALENQEFFASLLVRARSHRFFSHPFLSTLGDATPSNETAAFILTSFYKIVAPFTGLLFSLGGHAPDLRSRFALMDNVYEEMGRGEFEDAHPRLYLRMLASIGVSENLAEGLPTLPSIRRINDHLREVVERRPFSIACAVLASAESTIPPSFPVIAGIARRVFPEIDLTFFERHGVRDEGHSDDASTLFALTGERSQFSGAEAEVWRDLDLRSELFDEWMSAVSDGRSARAGDPPSQRLGVRPAAPSRRSSAPPPG